MDARLAGSHERVGSPFIGLVPFAETDARFFFGRDRETRLIIANMFAARVSLVYGASGVGKTSVLRAGVVCDLENRIANQRERQEKADLAFVYFRDWEGDVTSKLHHAIRLATESDNATTDTPGRIPSLIPLLRAVSKREINLFIILDQFEDYFLYHPTRNDARVFGDELAGAIRERDLAVSFTLTLRDTDLAKLDQFKDTIPGLFANFMRIQHLMDNDARDAITRPVEAYNRIPPAMRERDGIVTVEKDLVEATLEEVRTGRVLVGELGRGQVAGSAASLGVETPYLQLVMSRLWDEEAVRGSTVLRRATLADLGGARTIVRSHVERVLSDLTEAERDACAGMFEHLVTPGGTKIAHLTDDLAEWGKLPLSEADALIGKLCESGRRILTPVAPSPDQPALVRYEIYHDSLGRAISDWRRRLVRARELREQEARASDALERQERETAGARALAGERAKALRQARWFGVTLFAIAVLALTLACYAWALRKVAVTERRGAESARAVAEAAQAKATELQKKAQAGEAKVEASLADLRNEREAAALLRVKAAKLEEDSVHWSAVAAQRSSQGQSGNSSSPSKVSPETGGDRSRAEARVAELERQVEIARTELAAAIAERSKLAAGAAVSQPHELRIGVTPMGGSWGRLREGGSPDQITIIFSTEDAEHAGHVPFGPSVLAEFSFSGYDTRPGSAFTLMRQVRDLSFLTAPFVRVVNTGDHAWYGSALSLSVDGRVILKEQPLLPLQPDNGRGLQSFNRETWSRRRYWQANLAKIRIDQ